MIVVTGAAGFIGSCLIRKLNEENYNAVIAVDDFSKTEKLGNLTGKNIKEKVERNHFFEWLADNQKEVEFIFHLGARTDTTELDTNLLNELNLEYSKKVWSACVEYSLPLVYASSAATYGLGELGYDDDETKIKYLKPLNPYGKSKHEFDLWALSQARKPFFWAGLKFFNVYGPNEYHKGKMASVVYHAFRQIQETGVVMLFRSHNPDYLDGQQKRDFIYIKDVLEVCMFLMKHRKNSGIYNLGTGKARTFLDLAKNTFKVVGKEPQIKFIDTPVEIRDKYQYFTEANMRKLKSIGYTKPFTTLEEGIKDYVKNFLMEGYKHF